MGSKSIDLLDDALRLLIPMPATRYDSKMLGSLFCEVDGKRTTKTTKTTNNEVAPIIAEGQFRSRAADLRTTS